MTEQELFLLAIQQPAGAERSDFLNRSCGRDSDLRRRVEALLQAHDGANSFLAEPAFEVPLTEVPRPTEAAGSMVGPYRLLQQIGEGGFGVVYMAEQTEPVRRKVALKIIKPGMDTKEVIARFESERQALALMDHPNIARVLDAGATASGRPYFVMELVRGVPITDFCDQNQLTVEERMSLFVSVCLAVQHAHHKGVIHRDIKPSNVMVTLHDDKPVPKVIDFGVAKATSQQLTQRTLFTAYGQMIGTPVYMSPEQAQMSGLDIDTRSDVYSLGVLLYELLTGTTPIEHRRLREAGLAEMQRLIREVEAPKPSTRLSTLSKEASVIFTNRGTDARRLGDLLKGDVDWIVMKALEKDRQRRYDTPNAFAEDLQRFLRHEAIHARPPSATYRLQKFVQRNRGLAAAIGAVAVTLLLGVLFSTGFAIHARSQWQRARDAEARLQASLNDALQSRRNEEIERQRAEEERDRAARNESLANEQRLLAEQRGQDAEQARLAEAEQRRLAEAQREEAEALNTQLVRSNEEQRRAIYASEMNVVRIEAQRGNLQRMREILMAQLPIHGERDLRGFEWNYWYRYLNQAQVLMRFENFQYGKAGSASAVIPGGRLVAVTRGQQTEIREIATGRVLSTLPLPLKILVNRTRFSETGRSVHGDCNSVNAFQGSPITGSQCQVFEPTGEERVLAYPRGSFSHVSFLNISRDGRMVGALGNDLEHQKDKPACRLLVWNVDSQELVLNQVLPREVNRLEFSPDGTLVAGYLCHGSQRYSDEFRDVVTVVEVASGTELGVLQHNDDIDSVEWLPDGSRLLLNTLSYSGANRKQLLTWAPGEERAQRLTPESVPDYVKTAVTPDGTLVAVTGHTVPSIRLIDTVLGDVVHTLHNEAASIDSLTFAADGRTLVACSTTGEVLSWDLSRNSDLFSLEANPLKQLAVGGFALNRDQSKLAVALADGTIMVRSANGQETRLQAPKDSFVRGNSVLTFSDDGRYLAHRSTQGPDGKILSFNWARWQLELFDLSTQKRLWQIVQTGGTLRNDSLKDRTLYRSMTFTPDSRYLVLTTTGYGTLVMDCQKGIPVAQQSANISPNALISGVVRRAADGRLIAGSVLTHPSSFWVRGPRPVNQVAEVSLQDVVTGEILARSKHPALTRSDDGDRVLEPARVTPSPDGHHIGVVRGRQRIVELWNLRDEQMKATAQGDAIVFSPDGRRTAVLEYLVRAQVGGTGDRQTINRVSLWEVASGEALSTISLAGNEADLLRFSPDARRLLILHGVNAHGSGGSVPRGSLWDVESGREILDMPVADVNHYQWDLLFDPSGHKLVSLLFGKSAGTGGGGQSIVYDATPLSEQDDSRLVVGALLNELRQQTPLPSEQTESIRSRTGLKPQVRDIALTEVERAGFDAEVIEDAVRSIVHQPTATPAEYAKALRWALALQAHQPNPQRDRVLVGGAQMRCRMTAEALATLAETPQDLAPKTNIEARCYERERLALLLLTEQQAGADNRKLLPLIIQVMGFRVGRERSLWPPRENKPTRPVLCDSESTSVVAFNTMLYVAMAHMLNQAVTPSTGTAVDFLFRALTPF